MMCCPNCGYNPKHDQVVESNGWKLDPRGEAFFEGRRIRMAPQHLKFLHTIATAGGRLVSKDAMLQAIESKGSSNLIDVLVCRMTHQFADLGLALPFERVPGRGYKWGRP